MLGRIALTGTILLSMQATPAFAAPFFSLPSLTSACASLGSASQCAVQIDDHGTGDTAATEQSMTGNGVQFALTYQKGSASIAYTGQEGTDEAALTVQTGIGNHAFTYQSGSNHNSTTVQTGNGGWSATSSVGDGTSTSATMNSW